MYNKRIFGLCALSFLLNCNVYGQGSTGHSPYSRFGLGDLAPQGGSRGLGMAETGVASPSDDNINLLNPALLVYNKVTNFQMDSYWQRKKMADGTNKQNATGGGLSNLAFSFPITRRVTAAMGMNPYSRTDYLVNDTKKFVESGVDSALALYAYKGSGSLTKVFLATGVSINKNLSVGLQASYLLGTISNESAVQMYSSSYNDPYSIVRSTRYSRVLFKPSVYYKTTLDTTSKLYLSFGATAELGSNNTNATTSAYFLQDGTSYRNDTLANKTKEKAALPSNYRIGFGFGIPRRWRIATDFTYTNWEKLKTPSSGSVKLSNTFGAAIGTEWTPNYNKGGYFSKVTYRAGINFQKTPIEINGQTINDQYVSLGATLPIFRKESKFSYPVVNVALAVGQRGTIQNNAIRENYFRISLGFILNDQLWFSRYRID